MEADKQVTDTDNGLVGLEENTGAIKKLFGAFRNYGLLVALIIISLVFAEIAPNFVLQANIFNVLRAAAYVGIVALPMTFVIISGEIDISVGPLAAFSGVLFAIFTTQFQVPVFAGITLILVMAIAFGAFVGWLRSSLGVPSFISTLALWGALRGMAIYISDGHAVFIRDRYLRDLFGDNWWGVPAPVVIAVAVLVLYLYLAKYTVYGRSVYAVGGNEAASRLAGIDVARTKLAVLAGSSFFTALVGILIVARLSSGSANAAEGFEFDVIAAVVVGGASLAGGSGRIVGTLIGVLFIATLSNGLVLMGMNPYLQSVVRGAVILLAVLLNIAMSRSAR